MAIEITAPQAELVARAFSAARLKRVMRQAVNATGKELRRELPGILAGEWQTTKGELRPRGRGARPDQENPTYVLRINRRIRAAKLRAGARKFKKTRRGSPIGRLQLRIPAEGGGEQYLTFRRALMTGTGTGRRFRLLKAGELPERLVGGPLVDRRLRREPRSRDRLKQARSDLANEMGERLLQAFAQTVR